MYDCHRHSAMSHERVEVGRITGEQLIARSRHHDDQRIDSVAGLLICCGMSVSDVVEEENRVELPQPGGVGKYPWLSEVRGRSGVSAFPVAVARSSVGTRCAPSDSAESHLRRCRRPAR